MDLRPVFKFAALLIALLSTLALSGCWNSLELNRTAMVSGVSIDLGDRNLLEFGINILSGRNAQNTVFTVRADSLLNASRNLIQVVKRRPVYTHTEAWIFGERLARDHFVPVISLLQRDDMLRPRAYMFITTEPPNAILQASPVYKGTGSAELFEISKEAKYSSVYIPMRIEDFFEQIEGPTHTAFIPMVTLNKQQGKNITNVSGTAIIAKGKMVGALNQEETMGLLWLVNEFQGGFITIHNPHTVGNISAELSNGKANIRPTLKNGVLHVDVSIRVDAVLDDYPSTHKLTRRRIGELQDQFSYEIQKQVQETLQKLQKKYKTDVTAIGTLTYRRFPKQWNQVRDNWDTIFSKADISVSVYTKLINTSMSKEA